MRLVFLCNHHRFFVHLKFVVDVHRNRLALNEIISWDVNAVTGEEGCVQEFHGCSVRIPFEIDVEEVER